MKCTARVAECGPFLAITSCYRYSDISPTRKRFLPEELVQDNTFTDSLSYERNKARKAVNIVIVEWILEEKTFKAFVDTRLCQIGRKGPRMG